MRMPNPRNYESDVDYYEACDAYQAYLNGKLHPAQPYTVRQRLCEKYPDGGYTD